MLNGKGPYHFILDTGGSNMIDPTVAWGIGARPSGGLRGGGIGSRTNELQFTRVAQISIGGATLADQPFEVRELGLRTDYGMFGTTPKREMQGLIGYELPARFIVTIDYVAKRMTLRTPTTADASSSRAAAIPLLFDRTIPALACKLAGIDATCDLDTGSFATFITKPFLDAHPSVLPKWFSSAATIPVLPEMGVVAGGFGGRSTGQVGQLSSMQLGSSTLNAIDKTIFSSDSRGFGADEYVSAIVGNPVLEHFVITLDYPHALMSLAPAGNPSSL
jgi:hypothetical protein